MLPSTRRRILTLLPPALVPLLLGLAGVWLLDDLGRRSEDITRDHSVSLEAMADLHASLASADRAILFAVIQGDDLHPDVAVAFRASVDRARAECRVASGHATVPGGGPEAERLAAQIEVVAGRGEALLAAPAATRRGRYVERNTGFQASGTQAWQHLTTIRAMNEVAMHEADRAAQEAARRSIASLAAAAGGSALLTAFFAWRLQRAVPGPIHAAPNHTPSGA